jgi:hypothetical protein
MTWPERQIPGVARQRSTPGLSGPDALRHSHRDLDRLGGDTRFYDTTYARLEG